MKENPMLPYSQSDFIYGIEVTNWFLLLSLIFYSIVSIIAIRWILRNNIMDRFQKTVHIILSLLLPVFWFYVIRMIYKPIPGYKKRKWFDFGHESGDGGGATDDGSHGGDH